MTNTNTNTNIFTVGVENRFQYFDGLIAETIIKCRKQLLSTEKHNIMSIEFGSDYNNVVFPISKDVVAFGHNRLSKSIVWEDTVVNVLKNNTTYTKTALHFSDKILQVTLPRVINTDIMNSTSDVILINLEEMDIAFKAGEDFISPITHKIVSSGTEGYYEYFYALYSTNSIKKAAAFMIKKESENENWISTMEILMPGFYKEFISKAKATAIRGRNHATGKAKIIGYTYEISDADSVKLLGRPSLAITSGVEVGSFGRIALYNGTFTPEDANGDTTSDGGSIISTVAISVCFKVSEKEALKLILQGRARNASHKFKADTFEQCVLDDFCEREKADITFIGDKNAPIGIILDNNCQKLVLKDQLCTDLRVYSIGEAGSGKSSTQMLVKYAYAAVKAGRAKEFVDYIVSTGKEQLMDTARKRFIEKEEKDAQLGSKFIDDVLGQLDVKNPMLRYSTLKGLANEEIKSIQKLKFDFGIKFGPLTPDFGPMLAHDTNCSLLGYDSKGRSEVLFGETALVMGENQRKIEFYDTRLAEETDATAIAILQEKRDAAQLHLDEMEEKYRHFTLIKYPSASPEEYISCVLVTSYEIAERIKNLTCSDAVKQGLLNKVWNIPEGTIMLQNDPRVFRVIAGSDCDYDEGFIVFDKKLNSFLPINNADIILDKNSKRKREIWEATTTLVTKAIAFQTASDDNVGKVTIEFTTLIMMLIDMIVGGEEGRVAYNAALNFLEESIGAKHNKGVKRDYKVEHKEFTVNPKFIDDMMNEMIEVEWSYGNVKAFLADCAVVGRFYQETVIDATKTGIFFERFIKCVTITMASRSTISFDVNFNIMRELFYAKKNKKVMVVDADGNVTRVVDREVKRIQFIDMFARIQDELIKYFNTEVLDVVIESLDSYKYNDGIKKIMAGAYKLFSNGTCVSDLGDEAQSKFKDGFDRITKMKALYGTLVGEKVKEMGIANKISDEDAREAKIDFINDDFNMAVAGLNNNLEALFEELDSIKKFSNSVKGALLLAISTYSKKDKDFDVYSKNKFAYCIGASYTYELLVGGSKYTTYGKILHDESSLQDGDVVNLDRGMDINNGIIANSTFSGKVIYTIEEGEAFLTKEMDASELNHGVEQTHSVLAYRVGNNTSASDLQNLFDSIDLKDESAKVVLIRENGQYKVRLYHEGVKGHEDLNASNALYVGNNSIVYQAGTALADNYLKVIGKKTVVTKYESESKEEVKFCLLYVTK